MASLLLFGTDEHLAYMLEPMGKTIHVHVIIAKFVDMFFVTLNFLFDLKLKFKHTRADKLSPSLSPILL